MKLYSKLCIALAANFCLAKNLHQKISFNFEIDEFNNILILSPDSPKDKNIIEKLGDSSEIIFTNSPRDYKFINFNKMVSSVHPVTSQSVLLELFVLEPELFVNSKKFPEVEFILEEILRENIDNFDNSKQELEQESQNLGEKPSETQIENIKIPGEVALGPSTTLLVYSSNTFMLEPSTTYNIEDNKRPVESDLISLPLLEDIKDHNSGPQTIDLGSNNHAVVFTGPTTLFVWESRICAEASCLSTTFHPAKKTITAAPSIVVAAPSNVSLRDTEASTYEQPTNEIMFEHEEGTSQAYMVSMGWNEFFVLFCSVMVTIATFVMS